MRSRSIERLRATGARRREGDDAGGGRKNGWHDKGGGAGFIHLESGGRSSGGARARRGGQERGEADKRGRHAEKGSSGPRDIAKSSVLLSCESVRQVLPCLFKNVSHPRVKHSILSKPTLAIRKDDHAHLSHARNERPAVFGEVVRHFFVKPIFLGYLSSFELRDLLHLFLIPVLELIYYPSLPMRSIPVNTDPE